MVVAPEIKHEIKIPENVKASYSNFILKIEGPKGSLEREFKDDKLRMEIKGKTIEIYCALPKRKDYALAGTWNAHVKNMIKGVTEGFEYHLKILYAHFPMKVSVKGNRVVIENFMGERSPRYADIVENANVEIKGDMVIVKSINRNTQGKQRRILKGPQE